MYGNSPAWWGSTRGWGRTQGNIEDCIWKNGLSHVTMLIWKSGRFCNFGITWCVGRVGNTKLSPSSAGIRKTMPGWQNGCNKKQRAPWPETPSQPEELGEPVLDQCWTGRTQHPKLESALWKAKLIFNSPHKGRFGIQYRCPSKLRNGLFFLRAWESRLC